MDLASSLLGLGRPWWELVLRATVVYGFLLVGLRLGGKRRVGQLAPFDLVLLLVLANAVQNAMNAGDNSLLGGLILASTLLLLDFGLGRLTLRSRAVEHFIEGAPRVLIHNGQIYRDVLLKEQITPTELDAALRQHGIVDVDRVHVAFLEPNGAISVVTQEDRAKAK